MDKPVTRTLFLTISVRAENQQELLQTFHALISKVRLEEGCKSCLLARDTEDKSLFLLLEEWETQADLDRHLRSDHFGILLGAVDLLSSEKEVNLHTLSHARGKEAIKAAREKASQSPISLLPQS